MFDNSGVLHLVSIRVSILRLLLQEPPTQQCSEEFAKSVAVAAGTVGPAAFAKRGRPGRDQVPPPASNSTSFAVCNVCSEAARHPLLTRFWVRWSATSPASRAVPQFRHACRPRHDRIPDRRQLGVRPPIERRLLDVAPRLKAASRPIPPDSA